jgi:hypothetical protein
MPEEGGKGSNYFAKGPCLIFWPQTRSRPAQAPVKKHAPIFTLFLTEGLALPPWRKEKAPPRRDGGAIVYLKRITELRIL